MMLLSKPSFGLSLFVLLAACAQANPGVGEKPDATVSADGGGDAAGDTSDAKTMPRCTSNSDCAASPAGTVCDTTTGTCVQCTVTQDMCPAGQVCDPMTNACRTGCSNDTDCASTMGSRVRCDMVTRRCIGCELDSDCALGTVCRMGTCVPGCNEGHACGIGNTCCEGQCVDLQADGMNCGTCGRACDSGGACCAGMCQPVQGDLRNCGRCGVVCEARNGSPACVMGACTVGTCDTGYGDCDRMASNGCEADLQTDPARCGTCTTTCAGGTNARAVCAMGVCQIACVAGFANCDGDTTAGCEIDLRVGDAHCGACRQACPSGVHCSVGVCPWTRRLGGSDPDPPKGYGRDSAIDVAADASGNVYVTANFLGAADFGGGLVTSAGGNDGVLVSYTNVGAFRWARTSGGPGEDHGWAATASSDGHLYVTGGFTGRLRLASARCERSPATSTRPPRGAPRLVVHQIARGGGA